MPSLIPDPDPAFRIVPGPDDVQRSSDPTGSGTPAPAWFDAMADWECLEVPTFAPNPTYIDARNEIIANHAPYPSARGSLGAWNGGGFDPMRRSVVLGDIGGHGDGAGNELYELILDDSPSWTGNRYWTVAANVRAHPTLYTDGQPWGVHGWNSSWVANGHYVRVSQQACWDTGINDARCFSFDLSQSDPSTAVWVERAAPSFSVDQYSPTTWDQANQKFWSLAQAFGSQEDLYSIDMPSPVSDPWTVTTYTPFRTIEQGGGAPTWASCVYDEGYIVLGINFGGDRLKAFSTSDPEGTAFSEVTISGFNDAVTTDGTQGQYHQAHKAIYVWPRSGRDLWRIDCPADWSTGTFTCSLQTCTGATPPTHSGSSEGPFTKFGYIPDMGNGHAALLMVTAHGVQESEWGRVFIWRLPL